jgi:hypothetical protein
MYLQLKTIFTEKETGRLLAEAESGKKVWSLDSEKGRSSSFSQVRIKLLFISLYLHAPNPPKLSLLIPF